MAEGQLYPRPPPPPMRFQAPKVVLKPRMPSAEQAMGVAKDKAAGNLLPYSKVRLRGLQVTVELNGRVGIVLPAFLSEVQKEPNTLQVRIDLDEDAADIAVYPHQLEPLEGPRNVFSSLPAEQQHLLQEIESLVRAEERRKKKPGPKAAPQKASLPEPAKAKPKAVPLRGPPEPAKAKPRAIPLGGPPTRPAPPAPVASASSSLAKPPAAKPNSKPPTKRQKH